MILAVSPDSPFLIREGAALILGLHVGGGVVGLASGAVALTARKGSLPHRLAGDVFVVAMLIMGSVGAVVAPFLPMPQPGNVAGGLLACYLVATGFMTVKRAPGVVGRFEVGGLIVIAAIAAAEVMFGIQALHSPGGEIVGVPFQAMFILASLAALLAGSDLSVILRGGLSGGQRLARHLWRMCTGLLVALGSARAQPRLTHLLPPNLRHLPILLLPVAAVVLMMIYWLLRLAFAGRSPVRAPLPRTA